MKIVLATPLYPPEVAGPARYAKELATRLAKHHIVVVITYTPFPEDAPNVRSISIGKKQSLLIRLTAFARTLRRECADAGLIYAINGPSVELPILVALLRTPVAYAEADPLGTAHADQNAVLGFLMRRMRRKATKTLVSFPPERPEIIPIDPVPTEALAAYEKAWEDHMRALEEIFRHVAA